jgi:hypothetical protein
MSENLTLEIYKTYRLLVALEVLTRKGEAVWRQDGGYCTTILNVDVKLWHDILFINGLKAIDDDWNEPLIKEQVLKLIDAIGESFNISFEQARNRIIDAVDSH